MLLEPRRTKHDGDRAGSNDELIDFRVVANDNLNRGVFRGDLGRGLAVPASKLPCLRQWVTWEIQLIDEVFVDEVTFRTTVHQSMGRAGELIGGT